MTNSLLNDAKAPKLGTDQYVPGHMYYEYLSLRSRWRRKTVISSSLGERFLVDLAG